MDSLRASTDLTSDELAAKEEAEKKDKKKTFFVNGCDSSFNTCLRDDPALVKKQHGSSESPGPIFKPNLSFVQPHVSGHYAMVDPSTITQPRTTKAKPMLCINEEGDCSLPLRQSIRKAEKLLKEQMLMAKTMIANKNSTRFNVRRLS